MKLKPEISDTHHFNQMLLLDDMIKVISRKGSNGHPIRFKQVQNNVLFVRSLMVVWSKTFQRHEMFCHDPEFTALNTGWVELGGTGV